MVKKVVVKETVTERIEENTSKDKPHHTVHHNEQATHPTHTTHHVKKTVTETTQGKTTKKKRLTAGQREEMLIENFVGLQHAMTNLSIKFGALSENISGLLQVFEEAARNFATGGRSDDKDMLRKINALLDQNKTIAKGLVLMESKLRTRTGEAETPESNTLPTMNQSPFDTERPRPKPLPSI